LLKITCEIKNIKNVSESTIALAAKSMVLIFSLLLSPIASSESFEQELSAQITLMKAKLIAAETKLPSDIRATNVILSDIDQPLHQSLAWDFLLLQIYRNIILGNLEQAQYQLDGIHQQQVSVQIFSRQLYLNAVIALKKHDFEKVFVLLNRMNQLDMSSLRANHKFDIYILAANVYAKAGVINDALGYANKALLIAKDFDNTLLNCRALNTLSFVHFTNSNLKALNIFSKRVLSLCIGEDYSGELVNGFFYLAMWHSKQQQYQQEQVLLRQSIAGYQKLKTPLAQAKVQLYLAHSLVNSGQLLDADNELKGALDIIIGSNDAEAKAFGYNTKAILLEKMGLLDDAMFYFKRYLSAHKASSSQTKLINLAYLQKRFESKVSRQARDLAKAESQYSQLKLEQTSLKNWILLLTSLLIISFTLFVFVFFKRKQTLSMIEQQQKDELTQCLNLDYGMLKANELINNAIKKKHNIAIIVCNIDQMDSVNLNFNYDFGDIFLHSFAMKLAEIGTENAITIRKSGDEFILLLSDLTESKMGELAQQVHHLLDDIVIDNQRFEAHLSTGCTFSQYQDNSAEPLLKSLLDDALSALCHAKSQGGNCGYIRSGSQYHRIIEPSTP